MKLLLDYPAYENYYHFIGATKYRKNLFYCADIRTRLKIILGEIIERKDGVKLVESTIAYNHIHVLLQTDIPPAQAGQLLFGASSRLLRKEFPILVDQAVSGLWGGTFAKSIKDIEHFNNCISYIQRHQADNTKVEYGFSS